MTDAINRTTYKYVAGVPDTLPKNTPKDPPRGTAKAPPAPPINE